MRDKAKRISKEYNIIAGTIAMHKENMEKLHVTCRLDKFLNNLHSHAMNENGIMYIISMCKEHFQQSHDVVELNLPKINREMKEIVQALNRIDSDYYGENTIDENSFGLEMR